MALAIKTASETATADYNLQQMLNSPGGFEKIAGELLPTFIREARDYESFGRQILQSHQVSGEELQKIDGEAFFYYEKDLNSHAAFYGVDAEVPRLQVEGEGVNVGIMTIASDDATISLKRLLIQGYNYLERVKELSGQAIAKSEDARIINLLETLILGNSSDKANPENASQVVTEASVTLSKNNLVALKKCLSRHDVPLGSFVMNPATLDDVLSWSYSEVDQLTQREILETGAKYKIWGIPMITASIIPLTTVYCFAEAEYVGRMPILQDLTVKVTETANKLEKGIFMFEFLGIYLASHKAVAKLLLGYSSGPKVSLIEDVDGMVAREVGKINSSTSR
ncbi:MAG: HK97-fold major capsid protein [Anaerovoracaceae bacterium]